MNYRTQLFAAPICLAVVVFSASCPTAQSNPIEPILRWNAHALDAIRTERLGAFPAARHYAMVNLAMYDAINGIDRASGRPWFGAALVDPRGAPRRADPAGAAAAAGHAVLHHAFPAQSTELARELRLAFLHGLRRGPFHRVVLGYLWGRSVGRRVIAQRLGDGSSPAQTLVGGTRPGQFRADFTAAQYASMQPFGVQDPTRFRSSGPPALSSIGYAQALAEVQQLGDARIASIQRDEIARFWRAGGGTARPPGEWIKIAMTAAADHPTTRRSLSRTARMFALLGMALGDAAVTSADSKATYLWWRPATAIRNASSDGNPTTTEDPNWAPRNGSIGGSPEHTSGQSTFAAVASSVLAGFLGTDNVEFEATGDDAIAGARTFTSFSAAAAEAGRARIFAGIHFEFSNQAGQAAGRAIARELLARRLRPQ